MQNLRRNVTQKKACGRQAQQNVVNPMAINLNGAIENVATLMVPSAMQMTATTCWVVSAMTIRLCCVRLVLCRRPSFKPKHTLTDGLITDLKTFNVLRADEKPEAKQKTKNWRK